MGTGYPLQSEYPQGKAIPQGQSTPWGENILRDQSSLWGHSIPGVRVPSGIIPYYGVGVLQGLHYPMHYWKRLRNSQIYRG